MQTDFDDHSLGLASSDSKPLTPRQFDEVARLQPKKFRLRWKSAMFLAVLGSGILFLITKAVGDASMYFLTTDEASNQRNQLGERKFRLEGCVKSGSVMTTDNEAKFVVSGSASELSVLHNGSPPELFRENMPVVLEGRFQPGSNLYMSDRIMVRHSESYVQENADRVSPDQCVSSPSGAKAS